MPVECNAWGARLLSAARALRRLCSTRNRLACCGLFDRDAYGRSRALLLRCLSPAQRAELERASSFVVRGASGTLYRITDGTVANIDVLADSGTVTHRLCAAPSGVPPAAAMLAQKLMLETHEDEFLRIAVRHAAMPAMPIRYYDLSSC